MYKVWHPPHPPPLAMLHPTSLISLDQTPPIFQGRQARHANNTRSRCFYRQNEKERCEVMCAGAAEPTIEVCAVVGLAYNLLSSRWPRVFAVIYCLDKRCNGKLSSATRSGRTRRGREERQMFLRLPYTSPGELYPAPRRACYHERGHCYGHFVPG